ncbi:hypothetical protein F4825DRAFT_467793 [Nemania diffusa]|nr:hypothetical protein F4825DRAFT_467793 [Nemania diffusa]
MNQANPADLALLQPVVPGNASRPVSPRLEAPPAVPDSCIVCGDEQYIHELRCGHWHCADCLKANAQVALKSSHPFVPAKCCQVIPKELLHFTGAFTDDELTQYEDKIEELVTLLPKLYCWGGDCGAFIPSRNLTRRVGRCDKCDRKSCKTCKAKSHFGPCDQARINAQQSEDEVVYQLAKSLGWKRCPNCLNLVQKRCGCDHMRCHCGQDFCYVCGQVYYVVDHITCRRR